MKCRSMTLSAIACAMVLATSACTTAQSPASVAAAATPHELVSSTQLTRLFANGATIDGTGRRGQHYVAHHHRDGKVDAVSGAYRSAGNWFIRGDLIHVSWNNKDWKSGAWKLYEAPDGKYSFDLAYHTDSDWASHDTSQAGRVDVTDATITPDR